MNNKCLNCGTKQPNNESASKPFIEWKWPEDYECAAGVDEFPNADKSCVWSMPIE